MSGGQCRGVTGIQITTWERERAFGERKRTKVCGDRPLMSSLAGGGAHEEAFLQGEEDILSQRVIGTDFSLPYGKGG